MIRAGMRAARRGQSLSLVDLERAAAGEVGEFLAARSALVVADT